MKRFIALFAFLLLISNLGLAQTHQYGALDVPNTWTATQTFNNGIRLFGIPNDGVAPLCLDNSYYLSLGCGNGNPPVVVGLGNGTTVIDASTVASVQTAINTLPSTGGTVIFPPGTYTLPSSLLVNRNVLFVGHPGAIIVSPSNAAVFMVSGTITEFRVEGLTFNATGTTASIADFSTASNSAEARVKFQNNTFNNFQLGIKYGPSTYFTDILYNRFFQCGTALYIDSDSDGIVEGNFFAYFPTSPLGGQIYYRGANVVVRANTFVPNSTP